MIDPDSRLTQLGLLPVCPEENYYFFESRSFGGDGDDALPALARRWAAATFGVEDSAPYIAPAPGPEFSERPLVTVSLGVGENPAKRIADPFEAGLLTHLAQRAALLVIDKGAGGEEAERVERAVAQAGIAPDRVRIFQGSSPISRPSLRAAIFMSATIRPASMWRRRAVSHWSASSPASLHRACSRAGVRPAADALRLFESKIPIPRACSIAPNKPSTR